MVWVESKKVEDGSLKVADVDWILNWGVAEFVSFAIGSGFGSSSGHPHGEAVGVVISAVEFRAVSGFVHGGASEFSAPDDEGVIEKSALFEVLEEGGDGLVDLAAFDGEFVDEVVTFSGAVDVPSPVEELNEADALFGEASGEKAVVGE